MPIDLQEILDFAYVISMFLRCTKNPYQGITLNDVRLSLADSTLLCGTCYNNHNDCNGHFGLLYSCAAFQYIIHISTTEGFDVYANCFQAIAHQNNLENVQIIQNEKHCMYCNHVQPKYCQQVFNITSPDIKDLQLKRYWTYLTKFPQTWPKLVSKCTLEALFNALDCPTVFHKAMYTIF